MLCASLSAPQSPDSDNLDHKSRESLSSGVHLTVASDDTMSMSPETELVTPGALSVPPHLQSQAQAKAQASPHVPGPLCGSLRFPSLPEHLEHPSTSRDAAAEIHRHLSDPILPGS